MKRTTLVLAAALAFPVALAAETAATDQEPGSLGRLVDQKRSAAPDGSVSIEVFSGSVRVTGWPRAEVQVKGTIGEQAELDFSGTEKQTRVAIEHRGINPMSARGDIEVFVPATSRVSIEGFQATITVTGVTGAVSAETVNGSITQSGAAKDVQLQSVNGSVEATSPTGRVQVEAVNGPVTVRNASGELEASTVNGKLTVAGGTFDRAHLESVAGGIRFEGTLTPKATLGVETVSGAAEIFFPAGFAGDFTVSTFSGAITNELGPAAEKKGEFTLGTELRFTSGAGGAHVAIETLSGAIEIRKR
jgi:DUF4097 and DUF4098 domain-containing protein YvlB